MKTIGTAGAGNGQLTAPTDVAVSPAGTLYVVDSTNNRVEVFNAKGEYLTKFGTAGTGNGQFSVPKTIAFGAGGALFVTDKGNNRIHKWGSPWEGPPTFVSAFGATGSGGGQLSAPRGAAADGKGHVWVVDRTNNRIEEFSESGAFIAAVGANVNKTKVEAGGTEAEKNLCTAASGNVCQAGTVGSANGQFNNPWGIAITTAGNLWVADTGNQRLEEFNSNGEFIQKFGTKAGTGGSKGTEYLSPEDIAPAAGNMLWVSDSSGDRVAEFRENVSAETERWVRDISGTKPTEPVGIGVDASGDLLVADEVGNRVLEYGPEGAWMKTIGTAGAGNGQLTAPTDVAVSPAGTLYVVDSTNNRVEVFNAKGEYLTKFGTAGTGNGQFSVPKTIAFGAGGALFVTDKGNNRIHKWSQAEAPDPIASIEVKVDGKVVGTSEACLRVNCTSARQWTLNSLSYLGSHSVVVTATSAEGFTTIKTLSVNQQRDETPPTIQTGGELANAPEGWVQQESYGFTATGSDPAGYGDTSLTFKIDGSQVTSTTQSCPDGGCAATISKGIGMASYAGGAHQAEVVATDGAGNTATKRWTINVDPAGSISTTEAEDTLEAVQATAGDQILEGGASSGMPPGAEWGNDPTLVREGEEFYSQGAPVETNLTADASDGFKVHTADGTIGIEPATVGTSASATGVVASRSSAVTTNTAAEADTVVRPIFDGSMTFQSIRDASAPETYSWIVNMEPGQNLKLINDTFAEVYFGEHPQFGITAGAAHDAVGVTVPTSLSVAGNVLTFTVHHRAGNPQAGGAPFTYPVTQGVGWEGGFHTYQVVMPPPEIKHEESWAGWGYVSPPEPITSEDAEFATASQVYGDGPKRHFIWVYCSHSIGFTPEGFPNGLRDGDPGWEVECGNPFTEDPGKEVLFFEAMHGKFIQKTGPKHSDFSTWHEGSQTESIGCLAGGWGRKKEDEGKPSQDPTFRRGRVEKCVWWGETSDSRPKKATWGEHLTAVLRAVAEERSSCGDQCNGTPHPWVEHPMPPLAYYFWANGHYEKHETDCIDC